MHAKRGERCRLAAVVARAVVHPEHLGRSPESFDVPSNDRDPDLCCVG